MGTYQNVKLTSALAVTALICSSTFAQDSASNTAAVTDAKISATTVEVGSTVTVSLAFNVPQPWCGLEINWGDGQENTVRVGHEKNTQFPLQLSHTYQSPGKFNLKIVGKGISRGLLSAGACGGLPQQTVVTVESAQQKAEVNRAKDEADRRARELEEKEAELRRREEKLERDRRAQEKREQELKTRQQAVESKASTSSAPAQSSQSAAPTKKPAIDPF
jgi:hypothetical protein